MFVARLLCSSSKKGSSFFSIVSYSNINNLVNRYRRKRPKVDASIFDSVLSHTRRSDASEKREKNSVSIFGQFSLWTSFESSPVSVKYKFLETSSRSCRNHTNGRSVRRDSRRQNWIFRGKGWQRVSLAEREFLITKNLPAE